MTQDNKPSKRGTWCANYDDCLELWWNQCHYMCTVHLDLTMNVAIVRSAPGCMRYAKSCISIKRHSKQVAFPSTIEVTGTQITEHHDLQDKENAPFNPIKVNFDPKQSEQEVHDSHQEVELEQVMFADAQADFLHWHYHLNHLPIQCIQNMA